MKIAVLGGSFNPIHTGHLALADEVLSKGYDKVLFIPAAAAPHKEMAFPVSAEIRMKMVSLAIEDNPAFELETCEIDRSGTSYTWDTICFLEKKYEGVLEGKIGLVIGRDQFATFHLWKNARELSERCTLILGERPVQKENENYSNRAKGEYAFHEKSSSDSFDARKEPLFKDALFLSNELLAISSTEIRTRAALNQPFRYLVPQKVFKYIIDENIYGK